MQLVREQHAKIMSRKTDRACYPYGIEGLDCNEKGEWRLVPGAAPGKVTVLTGVSGGGKSTVAALMALGLARQGRRVLFGAWEMGDGTTLELLALQSLGWSRTLFATGLVTDEEAEQHRVRMESIAGWVRFWKMPFGVDRGVRWSNDSALDAVHAAMADSGCEVAIFDLWKRCLVDTSPDAEEHALVRQQAIAEETKCHVILVQQQRLKDVETRPDKRPTREGIKGSAAWVEVADTILGVHDQSLFKRVDQTTLELLVLKQRFGRWPLAVEFDWTPDVGQICNGRSVDYDPSGGSRSELDDWMGVSGAKRKPKKTEE